MCHHFDAYSNGSEAVVWLLYPETTSQRLLPHYKGGETMAYTTPTIEKIADYTDATCGAWRGRGADLHRGRMFVWFWFRYFADSLIITFILPHKWNNYIKHTIDVFLYEKQKEKWKPWHTPLQLLKSWPLTATSPAAGREATSAIGTMEGWSGSKPRHEPDQRNRRNAIASIRLIDSEAVMRLPCPGVTPQRLLPQRQRRWKPWHTLPPWSRKSLTTPTPLMATGTATFSIF